MGAVNATTSRDPNLKLKVLNPIKIMAGISPSSCEADPDSLVFQLPPHLHTVLSSITTTLI